MITEEEENIAESFFENPFQLQWEKRKGFRKTLTLLFFCSVVEIGKLSEERKQRRRERGGFFFRIRVFLLPFSFCLSLFHFFFFIILVGKGRFCELFIVRNLRNCFFKYIFLHRKKMPWDASNKCFSLNIFLFLLKYVSSNKCSSKNMYPVINVE